MKKTRRLVVPVLIALTMVLSGFAVPGNFNSNVFTAYAADVSVGSWEDLARAVDSAESGDTITLTGDLVATSSITVKKKITITGGKTIYSQAGRETYDSMFKVESGGELTIANGVTLSGKTSTGSSSSQCPDGTTYTSDKFTGDGYDGGATTYQPKGFFIHVEEGGSATLNGTVSDFITSSDKGTTPRYVAPIVANGSGATFNLGSSGVIKNNLVGYIANDDKSTNDANAIKGQRVWW